jgi:hypothetical protein
MTNQTRLFILVCLAFLPTVAVYAYASRSLSTADLRADREQLRMIAAQAGREYRRVLTDTESLLAALSGTSDFTQPTQPRCSQALADAMASMPHYTAMQLIEPDGFVSCSSLPMRESLYVGDRYYHQASIANVRFTVGDFVIGRLTGKPIVGLAYPVTTPGSVDISAVLAAYLDLDELANSIYQMDVPPGLTVTLIDRRGTVMSRVPSGNAVSAADTVGATVPAGFPAPTGDVTGPYLLTGTDLDGVDRIFAVQPLEAGGRRASGHLFVGLSEEAMLADSDVVAVRQLQLLAAGALFMFVLAWLFGHYTLLRNTPSAA